MVSGQIFAVRVESEGRNRLRALPRQLQTGSGYEPCRFGVRGGPSGRRGIYLESLLNAAECTAWSPR